MKSVLPGFQYSLFHRAPSTRGGWKLQEEVVVRKVRDKLEEVPQNKIPITYNILFGGTSSTSAAK